jgi:hypothetical protein
MDRINVLRGGQNFNLLRILQITQSCPSQNPKNPDSHDGIYDRGVYTQLPPSARGITRV